MTIRVPVALRFDKSRRWTMKENCVKFMKVFAPWYDNFLLDSPSNLLMIKCKIKIYIYLGQKDIKFHFLNQFLFRVKFLPSKIKFKSVNMKMRQLIIVFCQILIANAIVRQSLPFVPFRLECPANNVVAGIRLQKIPGDNSQSSDLLYTLFCEDINFVFPRRNGDTTHVS